MQLSKNNIGITALVMVATIAVFTALAHMACIPLGEGCYRAQLAPEAIVQSSIDGTWIAPIGTLFISSLFVLVALFALSAARIIRPLPLLSFSIYTISTLCIIRGTATLPLSLMFPDQVTTFVVTAGITWLLSGLLCLGGFMLVNQSEE